ncbi:conserved hypothetical protein, partial [Actinomyces sp. oral taxon 180 str. F0310]
MIEHFLNRCRCSIIFYDSQLPRTSRLLPPGSRLARLDHPPLKRRFSRRHRAATS